MYCSGINKNGSWLTEVRTSNACLENFAGMEDTPSEKLAQLYPNPARTHTTISFDLK